MRKIVPEAFSLIEEKVPQHILDPKTLLSEVAKSLVGIKESTGNNDGPEVETLQRTVGDSHNEAWCMSLVQTCLAYVEATLDKRSHVYPSEWCKVVWDKTPVTERIFVPENGDIVIWRNSSGSGHTGIIVDIKKGDYWFTTVEGNTSAGVDKDGNIVREGEGCYLKKRSFFGSNKMQLIGFLRSFLSFAALDP